MQSALSLNEAASTPLASSDKSGIASKARLLAAFGFFFVHHLQQSFVFNILIFCCFFHDDSTPKKEMLPPSYHHKGVKGETNVTT